ncbi:MAG: hypothetical protein WB492_01115 [Christiangramia sp.]
MKITGIGLLIATSIILLVLTILTSLNFSFAPLFYLMVIGQLMLIITVYKILTDNYTTKKTFKDMYEDYSPDVEE